VVKKLADRERSGSYKRMLEADPVIGSDSSVVSKFKEYQRQLAGRVESTTGWNRQKEPTLIGM